jgi:CheY-like chemotaxis protein
MVEQPVILLVEDDDLLRDSISDLLTLLDYEVVTAINGQKAVEHMAEVLPDCIICDLMMPIMDGIELIELLREHKRWAHIPVVLITAYPHALQDRPITTAAPDALLYKPFDLNQLADLLERLLA